LGGFDGEADDDDNVELEKSNVLLMGPTCSALVRHLQPFKVGFMSALTTILDQLNFCKKDGHSAVFYFDGSFLSQVKLYLQRH